MVKFTHGLIKWWQVSSFNTFIIFFINQHKPFPIHSYGWPSKGTKRKREEQTLGRKNLREIVGFQGIKQVKVRFLILACDLPFPCILFHSPWLKFKFSRGNLCWPNLEREVLVMNFARFHNILVFLVILWCLEGKTSKKITCSSTTLIWPNFL